MTIIKMMGAISLWLSSLSISSTGNRHNNIFAVAQDVAENLPRRHGVSPSPFEYIIEQPNGVKILAKLQGSEENVVEVDAEGYVILGTGPSLTRYEYAVVDDETDDLVPSGVKVGDRGRRDRDPRIRQGLMRGPRATDIMKFGGKGPLNIQNFPGRGREAGGVRTGTSVRGDMGSGGKTTFGTGMKNLDNNLPEDLKEFDENEDDETDDLENEHRRHRKLAVWKGTKKNLVIPMRFSDHATRSLPTRSDLQKLMNSMDKPSVAPTGSVKQVFLDSSYGQLNLESIVVDWVPLPKTEAYYADGNHASSTVIQQAIKAALDYLDYNNLVNFDDFESDGDGYIDAICFLHSGYGAEWGGISADGASYMNRIWSHFSFLYSLNGGKWTSSRGKRVSVNPYHISPGIWDTSGTNIGRIGVIAHETGHFLGISDLYDRDGGGSGIGSWSLMASSWGFNRDQRCPPTMCPWSKIQLNWLTPRVVATSGIYTLKMSYNHPDVIKIQKGFPSSEYMLIEYRRPAGFESCMPGAGLAIWHIDDSAGYYKEGFPGQAGWPGNGNHYRIALLQADGRYDLERGVNGGDSTDLYTSTKTLGPNTVPNSDSYKGGTIVKTGIVIDQIGIASGDTISFRITIPGTSPVTAPVPVPVPVPRPAPVPVPVPAPRPVPVPVPAPRPVPVPVPVPSPIAAPVPTGGTCIDLFLPDRVWTESSGRYGCKWYASGPSYCTQYGGRYANCNFRHPTTNACTTANMACCVCGGGRTASKSAPLPMLVSGIGELPVTAPVVELVPTDKGGGLWSTINFNDFESGCGIWRQSDTEMVKILPYDLAFSGINTLMVMNVHNAYTDPMNASAFEKLRVGFSFSTSALSSGESFFLEVNDGSSGWTTIAVWFSNKDFLSNTKYPGVQVELGPAVHGFAMTSEVSIRFRMNGSVNTDALYLDDVKIEGYS